MTRRTTPTSRAAIAGIAVLTLGLSACAEPADPEDIEWRLIEEIPIVAIDSQSDIYIEGYGLFGGGADSEPLIDYTFAHELPSGGMRQSLLSAAYEDIAAEDNGGAVTYPGSNIVTIYSDAELDPADARIEIHRCIRPEVEELLTYPTCVMPDGAPMDHRYRVDIHAPENTIVHSLPIDGVEQN